MVRDVSTYMRPMRHRCKPGGEALDQQKTNSLFKLISQQPDIDKIYLYSKDPNEAKYQFLINKQENRLKAF